MAELDVAERPLAVSHAVEEVAVNAAGALVVGHGLGRQLFARRAYDVQVIGLARTL